MKFNNLHDFVKYNYEHGYYDNQYSNHYHKNTMKDYDLGYYQAKKDYANNRHFRHYFIKKVIIIIINKIFKNKAIEIYKYIKGYEDFKNTYK
ncbi:hypothetical protein [Apilactobacillus timberlakei]|uniref:Uncharacterized protein n=1 Tax=Apilactobacillus timberlakei TaxID=2008380 RepID=A0ABY2YT89_9LACO|nr:hypothetical protein [Apilactobacillus timberlakei]TPR14154.1 hypothetical protein DY048_04205 [Apilactobacillus timberlakei]TPR16408.1 hypothetical protein DY052_02300 [Apilactobacillus timberlakei]